MSRRARSLIRLAALGLIALPLLAAAPSAAQAAPPTTVRAPAAAAAPSADRTSNRIVQRTVSFRVRNVNRSKIPCHADGKAYVVRGHITGPVLALAHPRSVTLFEHGLSYGEFFTDYTAQAGYNFVRQQAAAGHVTVSIDRLGYGRSDKPVGQHICFGSRADIAHQEILALRRGRYHWSGAGRAPSFSQVVLAGHSVGSIIAQAEAYSFGDINGLMVLSYSDKVVAAAAKKALATAIAACHRGGTREGGTTGPTGYVYFGASTPAQFIAAHFYTQNADPTVVRTTAALRNRDPCGDILSYKAAVRTNLANIRHIHVPVLVMIGGQDAIYPTSAQTQARLLTGSGNVTPITLPATGHALTLHYSHDRFSSDVAGWLDAHGFTR